MSYLSRGSWGQKYLSHRSTKPVSKGITIRVIFLPALGHRNGVNKICRSTRDQDYIGWLGVGGAIRAFIEYYRYPVLPLLENTPTDVTILLYYDPRPVSILEGLFITRAMHHAPATVAMATTYGWGTTGRRKHTTLASVHHRQRCACTRETELQGSTMFCCTLGWGRG